jgi:hypothetical protein
MKLHNLSSVVAVVLVLLLSPAVASAQRGGGWGHRGFRAAPVFAPPVVVVGQPVVGFPTVVSPFVVASPVVVNRPFVGGLVTVGNFPRTGFGTFPVRTGFGTMPVRTGFEVAPFGTGFVSVPVAPVVITVGPHHGFRHGVVRPVGRGHVWVRGR